MQITSLASAAAAAETAVDDADAVDDEDDVILTKHTAAAITDACITDRRQTSCHITSRSFHTGRVQGAPGPLTTHAKSAAAISRFSQL